MTIPNDTPHSINQRTYNHGHGGVAPKPKRKTLSQQERQGRIIARLQSGDLLIATNSKTWRWADGTNPGAAACRGLVKGGLIVGAGDSLFPGRVAGLERVLSQTWILAPDAA